MSEWIKFSDEKPLGAARVIVSDGEVVGTCDFSDICTPYIWSVVSEYGDVHYHKITHWQPLPKPPED